MGKLHTLRRAIKRNPEKWKGSPGAYFSKGKGWIPTIWWGYGSWRAYNSFIRKVLSSL